MTHETIDGTTHDPGLGATGGPPALALVIAWSRHEPDRVGELALLERRRGAQLLGRGPAEPDDPAPRLVFAAHRPAEVRPGPPLAGRRLSRVQLLLTPDGDQLELEVRGRCVTRIGPRVVQRARVSVGDVIVLEGELVLLVDRRPAALPALVDHPRPSFAFGAPDADGLVGETPVAWALRDRLAFLAPRPAHALILGPSGTGKELAARALHRLSPRGAEPLVARNAATVPEGLIDAELFGNVRGYPNPGMAEREGLIGAAHRSTLFLDELGELPEALQAHLLRVLDAGEYQRLGDSRTREADLRVVGATHRDAAELKHDLVARLPLRLTLPGLDARRADIPLVARALLVRLAAQDPTIGERFFDSGGPRLAADLVEGLLRHRWTTHVRELQQILWASMASSPPGALRRTAEVDALLADDAVAPTAPDALTPAEVQAALDRHGGNQSATWRELGLSSRDALYRLIKKHGLVVRRDG